MVSRFRSEGKIEKNLIFIEEIKKKCVELRNAKRVITDVLTFSEVNGAIVKVIEIIDYGEI